MKATKTARQMQDQSSASWALALVEMTLIWAAFVLGRIVFSHSYSGLPAAVGRSATKQVDTARINIRSPNIFPNIMKILRIYAGLDWRCIGCSEQ